MSKPFLNLSKCILPSVIYSSILNLWVEPFKIILVVNITIPLDESSRMWHDGAALCLDHSRVQEDIPDRFLCS